MIYWNMASGQAIPPYALYFDSSLGQYLENDVSTPLTQWNANQAFTLYARMDNIAQQSTSGNVVIYDSLQNAGAVGQGLSVIVTNNNLITLYLGAGNRRLVCRFSLPFNTKEIHVRYDGSAEFTGCSMYADGVLQTRTNVTNNLQIGDILTSNLIRIGKTAGVISESATLKGLLYSISVVDFVQTPTQILADISAGEQLVGAGSFLFRLIPQYKKYIKSLGATSFKELVQNLDMSFVGYPNPLVLGTNLILL